MKKVNAITVRDATYPHIEHDLDLVHDIRARWKNGTVIAFDLIMIGRDGCRHRFGSISPTTLVQLCRDLHRAAVRLEEDNASLTARLERTARSARIARKELEAMRAAAAAPAAG